MTLWESKSELVTNSMAVSAQITTDKVGLFVTVSGTAGNERLAVASTAGARAIGVLKEGTFGASDKALYVIHGLVSMQAGGTIAFGDSITTDATGKAIKAVTTGHNILGRAFSAGSSGGRVWVLVDAIASSTV
jgi:hypothetical protein